jgi:hypothetical protein
MSIYLWIGKQFLYPSSSVPTPAARLDKYCFNASGNWKVLSSGSSGSFWIDTTVTPGANDVVVIGDGMSASQYPGWIAARCPLLFGGYSGGVGAGTWSHTSTGATGTTYTSSLFSMYIDLSKGWSFNVPVGAGITGYALNWCISKDSVYSPATTAGDYTTSVSSGFRNPENPLKLKVTSSIEFKDAIESWYPTPSYFTGNGVNGLPFAVSRRSNLVFPPLGGNSYSDRGLVFDGVKSYASIVIPGSTATMAEVNTGVIFQGGLGQDLTINGGSYKFIKINDQVTPIINKAPFSTTPTSAPNVSRGNISINNVVVRDLEYAKADFVKINGGTAAKIDVHQFPYGCFYNTAAGSPGSLNENVIEDQRDLEGNGQYNSNLFRYFYESPTIITAGFSGGYVWSDQFIGITVSIPSTHTGMLNLTNRIVNVKNLSYTIPGISWGRIFDDRHYCPYGEYNRGYMQQWYPWNTETNDNNIGYRIFRGMMRQRVFVGGRYDGATYTHYIPQVNINSSYDDVDQNGAFTEKWMPWQLCVITPDSYYSNSNSSTLSTSYLSIGKVFNSGGFIVAPNARYLPYKLGTVFLSNHGRFDFTTEALEQVASQGYPGIDQWMAEVGKITDPALNPNKYIYVGGITGASGDKLIGGIVCSDHTGTILSSPDYTIWSSSLLPNGVLTRTQGISGSAWTTFSPTPTSI